MKILHHIRSSAVVAPLAVAAALTLAPQASPCIGPPPAPPVVCMLTNTLVVNPASFEICVVIKDYEAFASSPGAYCTCAFGLPVGTLGVVKKIVSGTVVFKGTKIPHPGWADFINTDAGDDGWQLITGSSGNWFSFSAPVVDNIPSGDQVDLCFVIAGRLGQGTSGPAGPVALPRPFLGIQSAGLGGGGEDMTFRPAAEVLSHQEIAGLLTDIQTDLSSGIMIGTDTADADGVPQNGHLTVVSPGAVVTDEPVMWDSLGGGVAGTNGPLALYGNGAITEFGAGGTAVLTGGLPNTQSVFVLGFENESLPYFGGTFVPSTDIVLPVFTDSNGGFQVLFPAAGSETAGLDIYMQVWMNDPGAARGQAGSNAVVTTVQFDEK